MAVSVNAKVEGEVAWCAAVLQTTLELHELAHEVEVGRDDVALPLDELEGVHHAEEAALHDVGDGDGGGAGHACHTVHEHFAVRSVNVICERTQEYSLVQKSYLVTM